MKDLRGKVAVVTGAASGIGRGIAEAFLANQMKVVLADVEASALAATASELESRGEILVQQTDVSSPEEVEALAERVWKELGAAQVLCNNAGVAVLKSVDDTSLADWRWTMDVNLWGVVHGIRSFLPRMRTEGEGHIVNTASMAGVLSNPMNAAYQASKQAVVALSEGLAQELRVEGSELGVSVVCPAFVRTRIPDAERNRPGRTQPYEPVVHAEDDPRELLKRIGMDPLEVGQMVVDAIREERFYVFTHTEWKPLIRARFEAILAEECPPVPAPPIPDAAPS